MNWKCIGKDNNLSKLKEEKMLQLEVLKYIHLFTLYSVGSILCGSCGRNSMRGILCGRNPVFEESCVGGNLWEESCRRNLMLEESRLGGIPYGGGILCERNPGGRNAWKESCGKNSAWEKFRWNHHIHHTEKSFNRFIIQTYCN